MKEQLKQIFDENADCYFTQAMQSAMTSDKFIDIFSELMNEVEMKLKEPNFYIVNSKKYLTDEQRNSVAEKITQMSTTPTWIEIKSEDDLPSGYYWIRLKHNGDEFIAYYASHKESFVDNDNQLFAFTSVSDYLPIHKPQPHQINCINQK